MGHHGRMDTNDGKFSKLSETVDRVLMLAIETNTKQGEVLARLAHVEEQHARTFEKLDGFLVLINRHEAEISALRASMDRVRERLDAVERSRA